MAIAITLDVKNYVLEEDQGLDEKEQTVFKIKPLSAKEYAAFGDSLKFDKDGTLQNIGYASLHFLEKGLVGWKNANGKEVKFPNLDALSIEQRAELTNAISDLTTIKKTDQKK